VSENKHRGPDRVHSWSDIADRR